MAKKTSSPSEEALAGRKFLTGLRDVVKGNITIDGVHPVRWEVVLTRDPLLSILAYIDWLEEHQAK